MLRVPTRARVRRRAASGIMLAVLLVLPAMLGAPAAFAVSTASIGTAAGSEPAAVLDTDRILASDGVTGQEFGHSVAISGDWIVVGAPEDNENGARAGAAYVYARNATGGWDEAAKLLASDGEGDESFGHSVGISGDQIVVGAYYDRPVGEPTGAVYVYERNGAGAWIETAKLLASDRTSVDFFGWSVATSGDRILVGALFDDDGGLEFRLRLRVRTQRGWRLA